MAVDDGNDRKPDCYDSSFNAVTVTVIDDDDDEKETGQEKLA